VQREKEYSCNLERFKGKVNTIVNFKGKIRYLVPSLLTNSLKFSPRGRRSGLTVRSLCYFSFSLGTATLFY